MSWASLPAEFRALAEQTLTPLELDAYRLWEDDLGYIRIGRVLGIAPSTARDRVQRSVRRLTAVCELRADPVREPTAEGGAAA